MPRFVTNRDVGYIKGINHELIDKIIETPVIFFSLYPENQNSNIYGESTEKVYNPGLVVNCLIEHNDEATEDAEFGPNVTQQIICSFYRNTLKDKDFYPERGDVVRYNDSYYEVTTVVDNQLLAGRSGIRHSIICTCALVNKSSINVRYEK